MAASYMWWARKYAAASNKFLESKQLLNKTGIVGLKIEQITKSWLALKRAEQRVFFSLLGHKILRLLHHFPL